MIEVYDMRSGCSFNVSVDDIALIMSFKSYLDCPKFPEKYDIKGSQSVIWIKNWRGGNCAEPLFSIGTPKTIKKDMTTARLKRIGVKEDHHGNLIAPRIWGIKR